jgi:polyhydroxyalkanoate synthase
MASARLQHGDGVNLLRSNDLIWPYVIGNYLEGKAPFPFDPLCWNSGATRMPAANPSLALQEINQFGASSGGSAVCRSVPGRVR